jgi:hypothetical protein
LASRSSGLADIVFWFRRSLKASIFRRSDELNPCEPDSAPA